MLSITYFTPTDGLYSLLRCLALCLLYTVVFVTVAALGAVLWGLVCKVALPVALTFACARFSYPKGGRS
jgi:hypothetical protein